MASFLYERGRTATTPNASQDAADVHETSRTAAPSVPGTVATGVLAPGGAYAPGWSMAGSSPDLFVVCKNCGSEVSPYITECPYCGQRLRKRAPKIERDEHGAGRPKERRQRPTLGRLRPGEMPGIKIDRDDRPVVSIALVLLALVGLLALAVVDQADVAVAGPVDGEWWRVLTTPFAYVNTWYQLACLATVAIFGALLEQRHGHVAVLVLWLLAASGGAAVAACWPPGPCPRSSPAAPTAARTTPTSSACSSSASCSPPCRSRWTRAPIPSRGPWAAWSGSPRASCWPARVRASEPSGDREGRLTCPTRTTPPSRSTPPCRRSPSPTACATRRR